jgi:hypothetical protein
MEIVLVGNRVFLRYPCNAWVEFKKIKPLGMRILILFLGQEVCYVFCHSRVWYSMLTWYGRQPMGLSIKDARGGVIESPIFFRTIAITRCALVASRKFLCSMHCSFCFGHVATIHDKFDMARASSKSFSICMLATSTHQIYLEVASIIRRLAAAAAAAAANSNGLVIWDGWTFGIL